jgi:hypothetical protein
MVCVQRGAFPRLRERLGAPRSSLTNYYRQLLTTGTDYASRMFLQSIASHRRTVCACPVISHGQDNAIRFILRCDATGDRDSD